MDWYHGIELHERHGDRRRGHPERGELERRLYRADARADDARSDIVCDTDARSDTTADARSDNVDSSDVISVNADADGGADTAAYACSDDLAPSQVRLRQRCVRLRLHDGLELDALLRSIASLGIRRCVDYRTAMGA